MSAVRVRYLQSSQANLAGRHTDVGSWARPLISSLALCKAVGRPSPSQTLVDELPALIQQGVPRWDALVSQDGERANGDQAETVLLETMSSIMDRPFAHGKATIMDAPNLKLTLAECDGALITGLRERDGGAGDDEGKTVAIVVGSAECALADSHDHGQHGGACGA